MYKIPHDKREDWLKQNVSYLITDIETFELKTEGEKQNYINLMLENLKILKKMRPDLFIKDKTKKIELND
jgi:hypothetical protein